MEKVDKMKVEVESPKTIKTLEGYEYRFKTAKGFYYALLNFDNMIVKELPPYESQRPRGSRWIFRGHWDSEWSILPSALRDEWHKKFRKQLSSPFLLFLQKRFKPDSKFKQSEFDLRAQIRTEYDLLKQFVETANDLGIECNYTPFSYPDYKKNLEDRSNNSILPIMALARHHGLPTRLLDFSYNPLFAAFFAASYPFEKRPEKISEKGNLCIWAIKERSILHTSWRKIPVPINRSSNLFAQDGILIIDTEADKKFIKNDGEWQDFQMDFQAIENPTRLIKLTLPKEEYSALLRLLWRNNITPARTMPNLDKVTQTLEYKQWLIKKKIVSPNPSRIKEST